MEKKTPPKEEMYQGVLIGIPTFGMISKDFFVSQSTMAQHIFTNFTLMTVQGKPVDIARNEIAKVSLDNNFGYVLFRDDDTIAPRDALLKLLKRLPVDQRTNPGTLGNTVIGGVVYSKTEPPAPMIFKEGTTAGFEDWTPGDLVKCDVIGMGCTLIPTAVFRKTLPYVEHYRCANDLCSLRYDDEYKEAGPCPACGQELLPDWFKTIRDKDDNGNPSLQTEDTYFLVKCKKAGVEIYCDTGVLCEHEVFNANPRLTTHYGYSAGIGPRWMRDGMVYYIPSTDNIHNSNGNGKAAKKNGRVLFNLGSGLGEEKRRGWINVDLVEGADEVCDIRNLAPLVAKYGQADRIRASHVWEHFGVHETTGVLREWLKALKPNGTLEIEVPDGMWAVENFLKKAKGENHDDLSEMIIMGRQMRPYDEHKTIMHEKKIKRIMSACKNQIKSYKMKTVFPKGYNQQVIKVKVVKK
jgi:predicted SAM-dependent methyltransferase